MATPTGTISVQIQNPDGSVTDLSGTVVITTTPPPPPPAPAEPAIPTTAIKVNLDNASTWKGVWDDGTPGSATAVTGSSAFVSTAAGRQFKVNSTVKGGGYRFSCHAIASGCKASNFVYEVTAAFNWSAATRWELDVNLVLDAQRVAMLCAQMEAAAPNGSGNWDVTFNSKWSATAVKAPLSSWADGTSHTVRVHSSVDWTTGNVTYIGVSVDGVYTPFPAGTSGFSSPNLKWSPTGLVLPNFQFECTGALSGTASINQYAW